jgi:YVTN family beta-propeller protein
MAWNTGLIKAGKVPSAISFSGSPWDQNNVPGSNFTENLAAVFNNSKTLDQVTTLVPSQLAGQPAALFAGGITAGGNIFVMPPLTTTSRNVFVNVPQGPTTAQATVSVFTEEATVTSGRHGGVLSNNQVIYFVPASASSILKVPRLALDNYSIINETFGSFGDDANKWIGAVVAQNGKIYCIPHNAANVLVIDPTNDSTYTIGSFSAGGQKWRGGCLAPANGKIYAMPYDADTVLVIDPATDTVTTIGPIPSVTATAARFAGCAMATSGKLYGIPYDATAVLAINPVDDTLSTFGSLGADAGKWEGAALAVDGKIYAAPFNASSILLIDPFTETTSTFGSFAAGEGKWRNPLLGRDGRIYMPPANLTSDLLVVGNGSYNITRNITQSRYLNKF